MAITEKDVTSGCLVFQLNGFSLLQKNRFQKNALNLVFAMGEVKSEVNEPFEVLSIVP